MAKVAILVSKDRVGQPTSRVYKAAGMTCWTDAVLCWGDGYPWAALAAGVGGKVLTL